MNKLSTALGLFGLSITLAAGSASAQELIFKFKNPDFGGNPNYGSFLFGLADTQKTATITDLNQSSGGGTTTPGIGGGGSTGGSIGGPTIIIPINTGTPTAPTAGIGSGTTTNQ
ncbi:hypothetical protein DEM26_06415 [Thioclava sp. NG1]|uniref:curli assembly protein CsgF n=1 Tax=Thioclava sp. NG1 TaxID=2182426 RepID=UPI000D61A59B|nr:curli assembly protein CsgF [Thioclava sp. NG1]PWE50546.1 hypothetical protein DEM26_06415 [Thioclava sp. NG1]